MSANLEAKKVVVSEIVEKLKNAECMMVVSYSGLTVEQVTELRKQCRENDVHYCVLKNRLVNRALQELNIEGLESLLEGPNAFVFSDKDVTAGPKIISQFIEKNKLTSLEIKGGLMGTEV
ncbi:MAG: 50S ribosomal protein L10, partial [Clostridia bacterium]|nr:50S ribosomal protein L10 [Clostridia bacterium]